MKLPKCLLINSQPITEAKFVGEAEVTMSCPNFGNALFGAAFSQMYTVLQPFFYFATMIISFDFKIFWI